MYDAVFTPRTVNRPWVGSVLRYYLSSRAINSITKSSYKVCLLLSVPLYYSHWLAVRESYKCCPTAPAVTTGWWVLFLDATDVCLSVRLWWFCTSEIVFGCNTATNGPIYLLFSCVCHLLINEYDDDDDDDDDKDHIVRRWALQIFVRKQDKFLCVMQNKILYQTSTTLS